MAHARLVAIGLTLGAAWAGGCAAPAPRDAPAKIARPQASAVSPAPPSAPSSAPSAATSSAPPPPAPPPACPDRMVHVRGDYCPTVVERCLKMDLMNAGTPWVVDRCLAYAQPTKCLAPRRAESFCIDEFEYPNKLGELPRVLTSWLEAEATCTAEGKRLCTEDEFNFACEGPEMLPYVYGYVRDASKCNIDQPYRTPDHSRRMLPFDACMKDPKCTDSFARVDQRRRIGDNRACVSWSGVFDLNGNVGEWVRLPGKSPPKRAGIKSGWWGPVRARCRATVTYHDEGYWGYELGFRCCKDAR